jgi:RNA polymerase sigma factor (TIGR02999 family)
MEQLETARVILAMSCWKLRADCLAAGFGNNLELRLNQGVGFPRIMSEITQVLQAIGRGEGRASEELLPLVYEELRHLAAARMAQEQPGQTLQATAIVHEAWLRLVGDGERTWQNRAHFFGAAAEAMRRILIENARRKSALKRGGGLARVDIEGLDLAAAAPDDKILLINEALEKLQTEDPEKARIVVMKFFGGLTNQEVAEALGVTERTIERQWAFARAWMFQTIKSQF